MSKKFEFGAQNRNQLRKVLQPLARCSDSRLRHAGNVIEAHEHAGDFKEW
jgi:hypothetical protein